jgi:DMSO reductase family type II enzyme molybdopterin subunit
VEVGTDAAFWLGCCNVMVTENLYDAAFVKEQTDLALLVRTDTGRYLRAPDVTGSGREDQLYFYDNKTSRVVEAPRGTLAFAGDQALEGTYTVTLNDGKAVPVTPAFELLKKQLEDYTPEQASKLCKVDAELIRELGRKVAAKRTCSYNGFNSAKNYHGDLMERAFLLAMGLSGNWGKPGTGFTIWSFPAEGMGAITYQDKPMARGGGSAELGMIAQGVRARLLREDPSVSEEIISVEVAKALTRRTGIIPPAMFLNNHAGYDRLWNNRSWQDPAMKKNFGECLQEAIDNGWWGEEEIQPPRGVDPQVSLQIANNPVRRLRQGMTQYPQVFYPKLKMLWTIETRMSSSAMFCDIVLPAAWYYEKWDITICITSNPRFAFIEKAVEPPGEARDEWEIFSLLTRKIGERAKARGLVVYSDRRGIKKKYDALYDQFTLNGNMRTGLQAVTEMTAAYTAAGIFPEGYTVEQFRKDGQIPLQGMGVGLMKETVANEYSPDKPFYSLKAHVSDKRVFPTYARRAQFYIEHPWFLDAGEGLPVHKDVPAIGGNHPLKIVGGHPRHSIHSLHMSNDQFEQLHRGRPVVHMNNKEAARRGIKDGDEVILFNDVNESILMARTTPAICVDQVIVYFWEAYQYKQWKIYDDLLVGQPKALNLAGGYDQIGRFYFLNGTPSPCSDRGVRVDIRKA